MFQVESINNLGLSRAKVWNTLVAFDQFARWNPYICPVGAAALDDNIKYNFRFAQEGAQLWTVNGKICELILNERISFCAAVGFPWLLTIFESYSLGDAGAGTTIVHTLRCTGLLAVVPIANLKRNFETEGFDDKLLLLNDFV